MGLWRPPIYGDRKVLAATGLFGLAFETLMDYGTVARYVKTSNRFEVLTHHIAGCNAKASKAEAVSHPSSGERLVCLRTEKENWGVGRATGLSRREKRMFAGVGILFAR